MPSIKWNMDYWNHEYSWPRHGEEWSHQWGNSHIQWLTCLFPRICGFLPSSRLVEIAPGQGRWTRFLANHCQHYIGFDLSPNTTEFCQSYLGDVGSATTKRFITNNGSDFPGADDESVNFVFSFDSLVHAELDVVEGYIKEISRVLVPGGAAFIHHSNFAVYSNDSIKNTHCRGETVSAEIVRLLCTKNDLLAKMQEIVPWQSELLTDCFSTIVKIGPDEDLPPPKIISNELFWENAERMRNELIIYS